MVANQSPDLNKENRLLYKLSRQRSVYGAVYLLIALQQNSIIQRRTLLHKSLGARKVGQIDKTFNNRLSWGYKLELDELSIGALSQREFYGHRASYARVIYRHRAKSGVRIAASVM